MLLLIIHVILAAVVSAHALIGSLMETDPTPNIIAMTLLKHEKNIQFFVMIPNFTVEQKSALPAVVLVLLEHAASNDIAIEFGRCRQLTFPEYSLKHRGTKIVYLNVPTYAAPNVTEFNPVEPFGIITNGRMSFNKYRDMVIHLVNLNNPWEGMKQIPDSDRDRVPYKLVFLFYNYQGEGLRIRLGTLQLCCPLDVVAAILDELKAYCQEMIMFPAQDSQPHSYFRDYPELEDMIGRIRNRMLSFPVSTDMYHDAPLTVDFENFDYTRTAYIQKPLMRLIYASKAFGYNVVVWELASVFNFTVLDYQDMRAVSEAFGYSGFNMHNLVIPIAVGYIDEEDIASMARIGDRNGFNWVWLVSSKDYRLMHGTQLKPLSPTNFESVLGPFQWYIWALILTMSGLASVSAILRQKGRLDLAGSMLSIWAPLVAQTPGKGIDRRTLLWHSSWVLLTLYINSCYLGTLSSITVVPEIRFGNVFFRSLLENNFPFAANEDAWSKLYDGFSYYLKGNLTVPTIGDEHLTADAFKDHLLLLSIIKEKKINESKSPDEVRNFFKLENRVWMAERRDIETIASLWSSRLLSYGADSRDRSVSALAL